MAGVRTFKIFLAFLFLFIPATGFAADWYVRPPGGSYGSEDGTDFDNAWDGIMDITWGSVSARDTVFICDEHMRTYPDGTSIDDRYSVMTVAGAPGNRIVIDGDCYDDATPHKGVVYSAYIHNGGAWADQGGGVWLYSSTEYLSNDWYFEWPTSGDVGDPTNFTVLDRETTLGGVQANHGSFYASGSNLYVHTTDDADPTERVSIGRYGYTIQTGDNDYITFQNLEWYVFNQFYGGSHEPDNITIQNSKIWYGQKSWLIVSILGMDYLRIYNNDLGWSSNGIYNVAGAPGDGPNFFHYKGNYIHDIGTRAYFYSSDAHCIGHEAGGTGGIIEENNCVRVGTGPVLYNNSITGMTNHIVRYNRVVDPHLTGGADSWGVTVHGDNSSYSPDSGNEVYGNLIIGTEYTTESEGICIRPLTKDLIKVFNNTCVDTDRGIDSQRSKAILRVSGDPALADLEVGDDILVGAISNIGAKVGSLRVNQVADPTIVSFVTSIVRPIVYTSGGTATLTEDDVVYGVTSGAGCDTRYIEVDGGSWAGGDAAGTIWVTCTGNLTNNEEFTLNAVNIFTMVGNRDMGSISEGESMKLRGVVVGTLIYDTAVTPKINVRNNIVEHTGTPAWYTAFGASASYAEYGGADFGYNTYYPDGATYFDGSTWAVWQARNGTPPGSIYDTTGSTNNTDPNLDARYAPVPALVGEDQGTYLLPSCDSVWPTGVGGGTFVYYDPDSEGWPRGWCIEPPSAPSPSNPQTLFGSSVLGGSF